MNVCVWDYGGECVYVYNYNNTKSKCTYVKEYLCALCRPQPEWTQDCGNSAVTMNLRTDLHLPAWDEPWYRVSEGEAALAATDSFRPRICTWVQTPFYACVLKRFYGEIEYLSAPI